MGFGRENFPEMQGSSRGWLTTTSRTFRLQVRPRHQRSNEQEEVRFSVGEQIVEENRLHNGA
jgi:hypothetical protein